MRCVRATVGWFILLLLAVGVGAQQDDNLEDLLNDLADESATVAAEPVMAPDETPLKGDSPVEEAEIMAPDAVAEAPVEEAADVDLAVVEEAAPEADAPPPVPKDPAEIQADAEALAESVTVRMQANEIEGERRLADGYEALSADRYEKAQGHFEATLRLLSERPENVDALERARRGHADADYQIALLMLERGDSAGARRSVNRALQYVPNHRPSKRLEKRMERDKERLDYVMPADRDDFKEKASQINALLLEGRDFYENAEYDKAEGRFEQVRTLDEYNIDAMRFLRRIEEKRHELATIERDRTSAALIQLVRDRWNPPREIYVKPPEDLLASGEVERVVNVETQDLLDKMDEIVIPALEFRNANIIDVIDVLRRESEKADEDGLGVNIVLKLTTGPSRAAATGVGLEPEEDFGFDGGGFGDDMGFPPGMLGGGGFPGGDAGIDDFPSFDEPLDTGPGLAAGTEVAVPKVTLSLRRVSLLSALQIITEYANLKFKVDQGIVFIRPIAMIEDLETRVYAVQPSLLEVVIARDQTDGLQGGGGNRSGGEEFVQMGGPVEMMRVDVRRFFQEAGVPFPAGTSITYNSATSQLIVRNSVENLEIFERLLPHFNKPPPQVEIEARFVEIAQVDLEELGLEWILTDDWELASRGSGPPATRERLQVDQDEQGFTKGLRYMSSTASGIGPAARQLGLLAPTFGGDIFSFSSILTNPELNVVLHALDQSGGTDLLSAPRITTRSGVAAEIQVVKEIIYPTEFESQAEVFDLGEDQGEVAIVTVTPSSFETREVGVILNVTPTVGPDGYTIDLTLAPEVAELVDWLQYGSGTSNIPQPVFASRNATTSILVWDGQTVVMGGLIAEEITRNEDKIPILGDIPLLGAFFRSEGERSVKLNLLIFVTARIVDPAGRPVNNPDALIPVSVGGGQIGIP